jgi:phosphatidylserine/phosphatidylglycerophosphate/cardiolipin synthase-like enzyme
MSLKREQQKFPTRNFPYRMRNPGEALPPDALVAFAPNTLHRRVLGLDAAARTMTAGEIERLNDPFGRLLRSGAPFPLTLRALLAALDGLVGADALPAQLVFVAGDGGHIKWSAETDALERTLRFVIARGSAEFTLLVSSSTLIDSSDNAAFLQIIGWDATDEVFHYYERLFGTYFWAGMSHHALEDGTRGQGPFDSHVNGSLVMKELRSPWMNWHAPQAGINQDTFAPADPLPQDPLFRARVTAERLESQVVRPGIRRWNAARVAKAIGADGAWRNVLQFVRQVVTDTTVNLASSETASHVLADDMLFRPPLSFFLNRDILFDVLELELPDPDAAAIEISGKHYRACLQRYDVHRSDGTIRVDGDVHFAFLTPEPTFEDTDLAGQMLAAGLVTERFLLALSMTDFTTPVFSERRARLLRYVPGEVAAGQSPGSALETAFVDALTNAVDADVQGAGAAGSPEREFLGLWSAPDLRLEAIKKISDYFDALRSAASDADTVDGWFRLAEYRRRRFRERKLAEFALTTPRTTIPEAAPPLRMMPSGIAQPEKGAAMTRFDPPGFLDDLDDAQKDRWSATVSTWLDRAAAGQPAQNDGPRRQFFNALTAPPSGTTQVATIAWNAFPRQLRATSMSERQRWRRADGSRDLQDEYCEWSVTRNAAGRIVRVTFTCEAPEYWRALALLNPDKVVELYQTFISPSVRKADLFLNGTYNPRNRFNRGTSEGAMHLIQGANTLNAEIELAAAATIRRQRGGVEITDAQELILCSRYGEPGRNSDPFIGEQVNALARQKADITLNNPIGLYIEAFKPTGSWKRRDTGQAVDATKFWKFVRGRDDHFVRAVFEVPSDLGFVVGDITIDGRLVEFGAQITDFVTIKLEGLACRIGASTVTPFQGCTGAQPPAVVPAPPGALVALFDAGPIGRGRLTADGRQPADTPPSVTGLTVNDGAERALIERLPEALRRDSEIEPAPGAAPPALLPYPKLPASQLKPRKVTGKLLAYASPDSTFAVTKRLLDSAQESIVIGIYDFHADHIKETLKAAMQRGVSVSLMLDTNSQDESDVFEELTNLGAECVRAPSSSAGNPIKFFDNAHEKIIVVDRQLVMIQSGNWSDNSIPFNEGDGVVVGSFRTGNRDMGLAVHSPELAGFFADLVARDMRLAQGLPPDALPPSAIPEATASPAADIFFEAAPPAIPVMLFKSLTVTPACPASITPVITPENFHEEALKFLRSATTSLRIEQQYIRGGQPAIEELLEAVKAARTDHPDLTIQIIVSPKFLTGNNRTRFLDAMNRFGLEFDQHWRFLSSTHFVHCHNKLIVVDGEKVLLGSQNWSTTGVKTNREASLLVEHARIAGYFAEVFDADWRMSEPVPMPPGTVLGIGPETIVESREFGRGGVVISSVRDYLDV